jgi:class 3 adenylate cyclase
MRPKSGEKTNSLSAVTADERFYVHESLTRRHLSQTEAAVKVGLVCHAAALIAVPIMAQGEFKAFLMSVHAMVALASLLCLNLSPWQTLAVKYLYPVLLTLLPLCYLYTVHENVASGNEHGTLYSAVAAFMICVFAVMIDPGSTALQLIIATIISAAGFWAYETHPTQMYIATINAIAAYAGVGFTALYKAQHTQLAIREYNLLIRAAPAKIVRQAVSTNISVQDAFAPIQRHCVCISSDWRGYQDLSTKIAAIDLSRALNSYYDTCARLLNESFPDGNFYTDWIADELFIVIFAKDKSEERVLVNQALRFADALLARKEEFVATYGIPNAIDIGISSGEALIGMMGPETHRKATALGDIPGIARRLQAAGKLVRARHGEHDRVIFDANTLMEITEGFEVHEFSIPGDEKIRDLATSKIFYMQGVSNRDKAA